MMENLQIALGKKPYPHSKISINALGEIDVEVEHRYKFDPRAAEEAIRILLPAVEKLEMAAKSEAATKEQKSRNENLGERLAKFSEEVGLVPRGTSQNKRPGQLAQVDRSTHDEQVFLSAFDLQVLDDGEHRRSYDAAGPAFLAPW